MNKNRTGDRLDRDARDVVHCSQVIRDPAAAGLALVRAASAVLHHRGDLVQITPRWVEAYVRVDRTRDIKEEQ